jgi:glucose/arabinose dehydrogenase
VYYTRGGAMSGDMTAILSTFTVSADANVANAGSERVLLQIPQSADNHNGGGMNFGSDGHLYLGLGDGGWTGVASADIDQNGQNAGTLLGSILRLTAEGMPAPGNMPGALPEIWDIGVRNPWRVTFDGCTGDMYIGDPGFEGEATATEEINVEPRATGHNNYGWPLMEGANCRQAGCDMSPFIVPTDSYPQQTGAAVIGGYVYRGSAIPGLRGHYLYGDYGQARFWSFRYQAGVAVDKREITADLNPGGFGLGTVISFGQDRRGELYLLVWSEGDPKIVGDLFRIDPE